MKAILLDRDGVINPLIDTSEGKISPQNIEEFKLFDGVKNKLKEAKRAGFALIIFTNQPDVQKTWRELNEENIKDINEFILDIGIDAVYACTHGPIGDKENNHYRENGKIMVCDCRKPQPGLIEKVSEDFTIDFSRSYVIGDSCKDLEAASRFEEKHEANFKAKFSVGKDLENADRTVDNVNTAINKIIEGEQS